MPTIAAYIGTSNFCALLYKGKNEYEFFNSPYVYIPELFSNYTTEEEFYTTILKLFCKRNGVKFSSCDTYISGFVNVNDFKDKRIKKVNFTDLFSNMKDFYPVIVNDFAFATRFFMISQTSYGFLKNGNDETTFRINKCIYPHLKALDVASQLSMDKEVLNAVIDENLRWDPKTPIVFMGSRFYGEEEKELDYIYMLSLIDAPGVYDIYLDRTHAFLLFNMLNVVNEKDKIKLDLKSIEHVGTLVTAKSSVECMITRENSKSEVFDIDKDSVERILLNENTQTRLIVKNHDIGAVEKIVSGGKLGVIIDTREDKVEAFSNIRRFDSYVQFLNK